MSPNLEEVFLVAVLTLNHIIVYNFINFYFQFIYNLLLRFLLNMLEQTQIQIIGSYTFPKCNLKRNATKSETQFINIAM